MTKHPLPHVTRKSTVGLKKIMPHPSRRVVAPHQGASVNTHPQPRADAFSPIQSNDADRQASVYNATKGAY